LDEHGSTGGARRSRQAAITRQQHAVQDFRQRHIDGVTGGKILPQFPHALEQRLVGVALQILNIREVGCMETLFGIVNARGNGMSGGRAQNQLEQRGRV
jgi:hypothetical protein